MVPLALDWGAKSGAAPPAQVDPILLHILLELDCSRSGIDFPPMKAQLHPLHGWLPVVDKAAARSTQATRSLPGVTNPTELQSQVGPKTLAGPDSGFSRRRPAACPARTAPRSSSRRQGLRRSPVPVPWTI